MYILLSEEKTVSEIIPDENPIFPGIPIEQRYAPDFVSKLIHFPNGILVEQNWIYDPETQTFSEPIPPKPVAVQEEQTEQETPPE